MTYYYAPGAEGAAPNGEMIRETGMARAFALIRQYGSLEKGLEEMRKKEALESLPEGVVVQIQRPDDDTAAIDNEVPPTS